MSLTQTSTSISVAGVNTTQLRVELKAWEHEFLATHGRKPGNSDIKANRELASKYKLYDKLSRRPTSSSSKASASIAPKISNVTTPSKKRKRPSHRDSGISFVEDSAATSPQKTPRKADGTVHPADIDPYDPPFDTFFSPISQRSFVAPTPQKNGRVLGLFDLLSPESARKMTPSKSRDRLEVDAGTPSRKRAGAGDLLSGTPSRRAAAFADALTPSKNRVNGSMVTPSTQRTKQLDLDLETPECLKRYPEKRAITKQGAENAGAHGSADGMMHIAWSPVSLRLARKPLGRSYSELAKERKKLQEKKLDDELDVLRDLEADESRPVKKLRASPDANAEPLGRDIPSRQIKNTAPAGGNDMPLGPNGEHEIAHTDEEEDGAAGQRRFKKKGPKRQTKKFNIRPTHHLRWKPEAKWKAAVEPEDEDGNKQTENAVQDAADIVPESQAPPTIEPADDSASGSEFESEDELASDVEKPKSKAEATATAKAKARKSAAAKKAAVKDEKKKKKAEKPKPVKKVSATAHANFRTLNIKNKNSKGTGGGRFGRRRR